MRKSDFTRVTKLFLFLTLVCAISSLISFSIHQSFISVLSSAHNVVLDDLKNKSRKALVYDNFDELNASNEVFINSSIGFLLKNKDDIVIYSHNYFAGKNVINYEIGIEGLSNDTALMLITNENFDASKIAGKNIGKLAVNFFYTEPLLIFRIPISLIVAFLLCFSLKGVFYFFKCKSLENELEGKEQDLKVMSERNVFSSKILVNVFEMLAKDFKKSIDMLLYRSNERDQISGFAHKKMQITINSLLEMKDSILNYSEFSAMPEDIYFLGNLNSQSALKLGFKVMKNIELKEFDLSACEKNSSRLPVVLVDLDPLVNDEEKIYSVVKSISVRSYIIGLIPQNSDTINQSISDQLDWIFKQPISINDVVKVIKNKPSVNKIVENCFSEE